MANGLRNIARLVRIQRARLAFADRAKSAMTRANVAAQHEGRSAIRPAFKDVRALRFLTDGVQVQPLNQLQQMILVRRIAQTNAQPFRLGLTRLGIQDLEFAGQIYLDQIKKYSNITS